MTTPRYVVTQQLLDLADILADWIAPAPNIPAVYLFGSRVRGDHRPDSDVDVRLLLNEWGKIDQRDREWWIAQNTSDFADLKAKLPGPLAIHREASDDADAAILAGRKTPLLIHRRVVCVITPRKK
jgi:predicted nucleotidyltransferase